MTDANILYNKIIQLTNQIGTLAEQLEIITNQWMEAKDAED